MNDKYEVVVGLEIHSELKSQTKVFCSCANVYGAEPNTLVCPVCLGLPGTSPVVSKKCMELTVKAGLMTNCKINEYSYFERKNYFYPDLTKSYQISQVALPTCVDGYVTLSSGKKIGISDIHLEEDTGKLTHIGEKSYIDYNRCGVPLIETVTAPDISSGDEAVEFLEKLRGIYIYGDIAECKLEQGGMRFDVNLSVRLKGDSKLGERVEMKNLNSFRSVKRAIEYESARQIALLEAGETIPNETRKWDEDKNENVPMRAKLATAVYRCFADPDLPMVHIKKEFIEEIKSSLPLNVDQLKDLYVNEYGLTEYDAGVLTANKMISDFYNDCIKLGVNPKELSTWVQSELMRNVKESIDISAENFVKIIKMSGDKKISRTNAVPLIKEVMKTGKDPEVLAKEMDIINSMNDDDLEPLITALIEANPKAVADYQVTPDKIITFFVGQLMKQTKGKANVVKAKQILNEKLGKN